MSTPQECVSGLKTRWMDQIFIWCKAQKLQRFRSGFKWLFIMSSCSLTLQRRLVYKAMALKIHNLPFRLLHQEFLIQICCLILHRRKKSWIIPVLFDYRQQIDIGTEIKTLLNSILEWKNHLIGVGRDGGAKIKSAKQIASGSSHRSYEPLWHRQTAPPEAGMTGSFPWGL